MKALLIFLLGLAVGYVIAPAPKTLAPKVKAQGDCARDCSGEAQGERCRAACTQVR